MKIKTFVVLLIICICMPLITVKSINLYKQNSIRKSDVYSGYIIQLKSNDLLLDRKNISITDLNKDNIPLNIDVLNCNNKPAKFKLLVLVNNKPVEFTFNKKSYNSIDFTMGVKPKVTLDLNISSNIFINKNNNLMIMILKQEDVNRYNDESSTWCNIINIGSKDYDVSQLNKYYFNSIDSKFEGMILNNDFKLTSDYNGYSYNKKKTIIKIDKTNFKVALRVAELKNTERYLIFFTYGDKLAKVNGENAILMSSKENSSGFAILNIDINEKCNEKYLVCHMVKNPYEPDKTIEILSSNKVCIN